MKKINIKERTGYVFEERGKWYARVTVSDKKGKRRNIKRTAASKADAKEILKKLLRQLDDEGTTVIESWRMTFNNLVDYYALNYVKPAKFINDQKVEGLRDTKRIQGFLKNFRKHFGNTKLSEISYGDIVSFRSERFKTLTPKGTVRTIASMNRELACLRRVFNIALRQGWINKNPINCGEPLILTSCERRREKVLTATEEKRLLEVCSASEREIRYVRKGKEIVVRAFNDRQHLKPLLIALLDTGARLSEMLKLVWKDVDLEQRLITIKAQNTKTLKTRQVGITQRLYDELFELRNKHNVSAHSIVFGIANNVRKSFKSVCRDAGIEQGGITGFTIHSCRHTAAFRLINGQLPIQMVGRILGHTQPQTTYRYLSAGKDTLRQAASILESIQQKNDSEISSDLIN